ncbi:hypothetical protein QQF64_010805, partial [Cirrhinus molitorella]
FTVNLTRGNDIAFHLNPRFNEDGRQVIVRNSMIGNQWGREEREHSSFPFVPGKPFELKILCTDTEFKVAVNKSHLLEYKHRIRELNQIKGVTIYNDVTLNHQKNKATKSFLPSASEFTSPFRLLFYFYSVRLES